MNEENKTNNKKLRVKEIEKNIKDSNEIKQKELREREINEWKKKQNTSEKVLFAKCWSKNEEEKKRIKRK